MPSSSGKSEKCSSGRRRDAAPSPFLQQMMHSPSRVRIELMIFAVLRDAMVEGAETWVKPRESIRASSAFITEVMSARPARSRVKCMSGDNFVNDLFCALQLTPKKKTKKKRLKLFQ